MRTIKAANNRSPVRHPLVSIGNAPGAIAYWRPTGCGLDHGCLPGYGGRDQERPGSIAENCSCNGTVERWAVPPTAINSVAANPKGITTIATGCSVPICYLFWSRRSKSGHYREDEFFLGVTTTGDKRIMHWNTRTRKCGELVQL